MNIDPREVIYRPFWTQANGSMLESQNYHHPSKAVNLQYSWARRRTGLPDGRTMSYPNLPAEPLDESLLHYGSIWKLKDPFIEHKPRTYQATPPPTQPTTQPMVKKPGIIERIIKAISDFVKAILKALGIGKPKQVPQQTNSNPSPQPQPQPMPPKPIPPPFGQIGKGGPFATHTTIFTRQVIP